MRLHSPSPPQGKNNRSLLFSLLPPHLQYSPPQQSGGGAVALDRMAYEDLDIMGYEAPNWLNTQFLQRIPLTINGGQVQGTLTDFPLLINDLYSDLVGQTEAQLRFAGPDDIQLEYEIEKFDTGNGELVAWVKKPSVSNGDVINIYFDNPGAIDEQNPNAVWDSNFILVNHMNTSLLDSTSNGNDLTNFGSTVDSVGQIGESRLFDGTQNMTAADSPSLNITTEITLSCWIKSTINAAYMIGKEDTSGDRPYSMRTSGKRLIFAIETAGGFTTRLSPGTLPDDFTYCVCTYDGDFMRLYLDGIEVASLAKTGDILTDPIILMIGERKDGNFGIDGNLDESRISNIARSADYILTEFNNQDNPGTFYSTGTVESVPTTLDNMGYDV